MVTIQMTVDSTGYILSGLDNLGKSTLACFIRNHENLRIKIGTILSDIGIFNWNEIPNV